MTQLQHTGLVSEDQSALGNPGGIQRGREHIPQSHIDVRLARQCVRDAAQEGQLGGLHAAALREGRHRCGLRLELMNHEPRVPQFELIA
jgi:hypothetical protein